MSRNFTGWRVCADGAEGVFSRESLYGHQIKVKKLQTIHAGDFLLSHIQAAYGAMALVPQEFDGAKVSELYTILRAKGPEFVR